LSVKLVDMKRIREQRMVIYTILPSLHYEHRIAL
jgi:hypothetical protein